jgi:hypothetical protein
MVPPSTTRSALVVEGAGWRLDWRWSLGDREGGEADSGEPVEHYSLHELT